MADFKLNIGDPKSKKTVKKEVKDSEADIFLKKKIGDKVAGEGFGYPGYEFEITGGSDYTGTPMRRDVMGTARKRILIVSGTGIRKNRAGRKVRRTLAGNTVYSKTAQINLKVTKAGKAPLFEEEKTPSEAQDSSEASSEKPAEAKAPAADGGDSTPAPEKQEAAPKEAPKEEPKPEEKPAEEKPAEKKE